MVEQYNGPFEISRYCRGNILAIQGIISFFTGFPLTIYDCKSSTTGIEPIDYKEKSNYLRIKNVDYSSDLNLLLKRINEESELIMVWQHFFVQKL
jgi:hypothetical protein